MLTCFKYRSGEAALHCLAEGTLYFAAPHELNDSLEAKFDHAGAEDFSRVMAQAYSEVSQERGEAALSFDRATLDMSIANATENERLQAFCDQVGIFSAGRRPGHQAMWAYYADNCQGVCFELAWSHRVMEQHQLWPVDVLYSDQARVHNRADDLRTAFLELASEHPNATLEQLHQLALDEVALRKWGVYTAARAVSIKHTDWAHENEIRILSPHGKIALPVLSEVLKRVHFIRTDGDKWGKIMQLLFTRYPHVQTMQWTLHHGEIKATGREMEFRLIPG